MFSTPPYMMTVLTCTSALTANEITRQVATMRTFRLAPVGSLCKTMSNSQPEAAPVIVIRTNEFNGVMK